MVLWFQTRTLNLKKTINIKTAHAVGLRIPKGATKIKGEDQEIEKNREAEAKRDPDPDQTPSPK